ncbi:MAG TPA: hypothetical protein VJK26_00255 [Patescibacteria group bacterium]|nr:hypothetical protein [Patescibacteria group bacterium]
MVIKEELLRSFGKDSIEPAIRGVESLTDIIHEQGLLLKAIAHKLAPFDPFNPPKAKKLSKREAEIETMASDITARIFTSMTGAVDSYFSSAERYTADDLDIAIAHAEVLRQLLNHIRCELTIAASGKIASKTGILLKLLAAGVTLGVAYLVIDKIRQGEDEVDALKRVNADKTKND